MLSPDELKDGKTFILQLPATSDATREGHATRGGSVGAGGPSGGRDNSDDSVHWIETLRGDVARRWYDIYRRSDWAALRAEAADVFHRRVSEPEAVAARTARCRCVFIHTVDVAANELVAARGSAT
jgi:hypothetical protein